MSYCDRKLHRGIIYRAAGFDLYRTNSTQIETWRKRLPPLTPEQAAEIHDASLASALATLSSAASADAAISVKLLS